MTVFNFWYDICIDMYMMTKRLYMRTREVIIGEMPKDKEIRKSYIENITFMQNHLENSDFFRTFAPVNTKC